MADPGICGRCADRSRAAREEIEELSGLLAALNPQLACYGRRHQLVRVDAACGATLTEMVAPARWRVRHVGQRLVAERGPYAVQVEQMVSPRHTAQAFAACLLDLHRRWGTCDGSLDVALRPSPRVVAKMRWLVGAAPAPHEQVLAQLLADAAVVVLDAPSVIASRAVDVHVRGGHADCAHLDTLCAAAAAV